MSEIYPFLPAAVEVFRVGSKTDMILRKDIEKQEQTDDEGKKYTVYACDERQQRVDGVLTAEEVQADFDNGGTMRRLHPSRCRKKRSWKTG